MILIIGGYYQGKLEFALDKFNKNEKDVEFCKMEKKEIDWEKDIIYRFEEWIKGEVARDGDFYEIASKIEKINLCDKIIISTDISQGVVPMDRKDRLFRDYTGKIITEFAKKADEVYRVFCGIPQRIK